MYQFEFRYRSILGFLKHNDLSRQKFFLFLISFNFSSNWWFLTSSSSISLRISKSICTTFSFLFSNSLVRFFYSLNVIIQTHIKLILYQVRLYYLPCSTIDYTFIWKMTQNYERFFFSRYSSIIFSSSMNSFILMLIHVDILILFLAAYLTNSSYTPSSKEIL